MPVRPPLPEKTEIPPTVNGWKYDPNSGMNAYVWRDAASEDLDEIRLVDEDHQVDLADLIEAAEDDLDRLVIQPLSPIDVERIQEIVRLLRANCECIIEHPEAEGRVVWNSRKWTSLSD